MGTSDIVASYTGDPLLLGFARQFCDCVGHNLPSFASEQKANVCNDRAFVSPWVEGQNPMERWSARILYECIAFDKPAALILYLQMHHATITIQSQPFPAQAWSLRIVLEYFSTSDLSTLIKCPNQMPFLRHQFLHTLRVHTDAALLSRAQSQERALLILRPVLGGSHLGCR